jgi:Lrp/AsnC family leucine-responsive transcriptional regulator
MNIDGSILDDHDRKIIEILSHDGRISITELSARIGLSKTPCQKRLDKLIKLGVIKGFAAIIDPSVIGRQHIAFVEAKLSDTKAEALEAFDQAVRKIPHIEECHMIAGGFDYLLKVRTRDIAAYRHLLGEVISGLPHVAQTSTFVVLEPVKDSTDMLGEQQ